MTYSLNFVNIPKNLDGDYLQNVNNGNFTADPTNFSQLTASFWICPDPAGFYEFAIAGAVPVNPGFNIVVNASQLRFQCANPSLGGNILNAIFTPTYPVSGYFNVLFSVDSNAQVYSVYVNDVAPPVTTGPNYGTAGVMYNNSAVGDTEWKMGDDSGTQPMGLADVWLDQRYVDFSVVANRRKFITAGLAPVDLGAAGQNPFGTPPRNFLSVYGGAASGFNTNRGTGTNWTVNGTALAYNTVCAASPPPPSSSTVFLGEIL